jgi:hypothetical protein
MPASIIDYKVITYDFNDLYDTRNLKEGYADLKQFNDTVTGFLQKGYSLYGHTINAGTSYINQRFSQALVKYSTPQIGPTVDAYTIVYVGCPHYENTEIYMKSFENTVMDTIRDGWVLWGNVQYCQYDSQPRHHYSQTLIKYKAA